MPTGKIKSALNRSDREKYFRRFEIKNKAISNRYPLCLQGFEILNFIREFIDLRRGRKNALTKFSAVRYKNISLNRISAAAEDFHLKNKTKYVALGL